MLLHTVRFLCSVAAAFARLLRELRKAVAMAISVRHRALQSPPIGLIAAAPLALRRNKQQAAPVATVHMQEQVLLAPPQPVLVVPAPRDVVVVGDSGVEERQAENHSNKQKKVACAMMRRPSRLVIPVADDADEVAAGWGAAAAASENADVEVEGEGFCLASKAGPRHAMEDGYAVITDKNGGDSELAFYGVYDGHGGRAAVDFVSEHLGRNVVSAVLAASTEEASAKEDAVSAAIRAAYLKTDSELLAQQQGASGGACAATAVVTGGKLYVAHLGDCRAVLGRVAGGGGGATAVALTADHTCASEGERARVERDGGYVSRSGSGVWRVQGSLAVSRAFGDAALKRWVLADPAVAAVPISSAGAGEFLVVASDGLWDKVGNQEAVDAVRRGGASRAAACRELVDLARRRGSRDDVTVMVVDLQRFAR